jgi:glucokinase
MDLQKTYLAIDAGGTFFKSALLNASGEVINGSAHLERSYSEGPAEKIVGAYRNTVSNALRYVGEHGGLELIGIGIATPGPFDYENGVPLMKHKFASVYGVRLRDVIYEIPGVQVDLPISFMHDANAALAGEILNGNAKRYSNAALITLGTGLGFAFSQNSKVQFNEQGGPQITIFKEPYQDGILEDYVSKRGILKIYKEKSGKSDIDHIQVADIGKLANEGDEISLDTFREAGKILAVNIKSILKEQKIECLLFGGQISKSFHHFEEIVKSELDDVQTLRNIAVVSNMDNAALIGALWKLLG